MTRRGWLALLAMLPVALPAAAASADDDKRGWFGVAIRVETGGGMPWNPVLRSVRIERVAPASPAAQKGVAAGDEVVSVDGLSIAGRKARELEPVMHKAVGESLRLSLKRADGKAYEVTLVATARPAPPAK